MFITENGVGYYDIAENILNHHKGESFYFYEGNTLPKITDEEGNQDLSALKPLLTAEAKVEATNRIRAYLYRQYTDGLMADVVAGVLKKEIWIDEKEKIKKEWPK